VNELGLREHVRFTGFVTGRDKAYLLRRSDWFLLPSKQENFGIAVLEAVEQDCAIAISDRVYIAESFRPDSEVLPLTMKDWVEFLRVRMIDQRWRSQTVALDRASCCRVSRLAASRMTGRRRGIGSSEACGV